LLLELIRAVLMGGSAGAVFFLGYYWVEREKRKRTHVIERWIEFVMQKMIETVEVHNDLHPEAKVDLGGLAKILFDATNRPWSI
jgi:hypothetical protein